MIKKKITFTSRNGPKKRKVSFYVPVTRKRSKEELKLFLKSVMNNYQSTFSIVKNHDEAIKRVTQSYSDLQEWLYG